jgi:hypothetical protein
MSDRRLETVEHRRELPRRGWLAKELGRLTHEACGSGRKTSFPPPPSPPPSGSPPSEV